MEKRNGDKKACGGRRFDPGRRARILESTLEVIAEHGVGQTTLRMVAERADVPLGSMTYHFAGRDALLIEAFTNFSTEMTTIFEARFDGVTSKEDARAAIAEHICGESESWGSKRNLLLSYEMYAFTSRTDLSRAILRKWVDSVRAQLEKYFDRRTADALDALIEGYSIHRSVDVGAFKREDIEATILRVSS